MNKKKIGLAVLALALCIGIASATLLTYFAKIETTVNVSQSVLLDGKDQTTTIAETLDVSGGYYYGDVHYLDNKANVPVDLMFEALPNIEGIEVQYQTLAHLTVTGEPGTEDRVVITVPEGVTLGDIETISWLVFTVYGYPPHVDITLDVDDYDASMLTAEIAYNNAEGMEIDQGLIPTYGTWLKTFELSSNDGYAQIDDNTMLWVTHLGAGNDDAPWGTLKDWKDGVVANDPQNELEDGVITVDTPVLKLEIEVDNWIMDTEAYVGCIKINGATQEPIIPENTPFTLQPSERLYFCIEYYIDPAIDPSAPDEVPPGIYTITTYVKPA